MDREILFRGKSVDNGEWIEGDLWNVIDNDFCIISHGKNYDIIAETVGQYTGKDDKNGKKIFKGDICKVCRGVDIETGVIYYDKRVGAWGVRYNEEEINLLFDIFTSKDENVWIEVIGNIHDNLELLTMELNSADIPLSEWLKTSKEITE